jgi:hypothetical protein
MTTTSKAWDRTQDLWNKISNRDAYTPGLNNFIGMLLLVFAVTKMRRVFFNMVSTLKLGTAVTGY